MRLSFIFYGHVARGVWAGILHVHPASSWTEVDIVFNFGNLLSVHRELTVDVCK